jgi:glycosyltransferase involved in cell wall biosynthesis
MRREKVSIVTPTFEREPFLRLAHRTIRAQTYQNWEWLILDDSPKPSEYLRTVTDPRVRYLHTAGRMEIGRKRNELAAAADGSVIAHFDDDDYYTPSYLERMLRRLDAGCDFVKLSGWYLYAVAYRALGYWDLNRKTGRVHVWQPPQPRTVRRLTNENNRGLENVHLGYGFSYVYRTEVWRRQPFSEHAFRGEDEPFASAARAAFRVEHFRDLRGICLHVLHASNMSRCFPQYELPRFMLRALFPRAVEDYVVS